MHLSCNLFACLSLVGSTLSIICPPFLPTLPISSPLADTVSIADFASTINTTINTLTKNITYLGNPNTSFSLDVYSLTDSSPLFTYHFSGPNLANASYGVSHVDSSTTYMVGSVTKIITLYTYLNAVGFNHWNDPIANFIPELAAYAASHQDSNSLNVVSWDEVNMKQLASHLSGIARDTAPDAQSDAQYQAAARLSEVLPAPGQYCNGSVLEQYPCTRNDTLTNLLSRHPIHSSGTTPIYSNIAFQLIAWALEEITGSSLNSLVNDLITTLSLSNSYYPVAPPSSFSNAIVPDNPITAGYGIDIHSDAPSGAFYSSINDMRKLGLSILNNTLLPSNITNLWLKPVSFTSDKYITVGAPWEIVPFPPLARFPISIYSKAGDIGVYSSILALIPEYNIGFTILTAGQRASAASREIADLITQSLVPTLIAASHETSSGKYGGSYVDASTNSSVTLQVIAASADEAGEGRPYLQLVDWTWQGIPLLYAIAELLDIADPVAAGLQFNLYPTGLTERFDNGTIIESWRAAYSTNGNDAVTGALGSGPFSTQCDSWTEVDGFVYGGVSFDEFLLDIDQSAQKVQAVEARVLQQGYWEKEGGGGGGGQRFMRVRERESQKVKMVRIG